MMTVKRVAVVVRAMDLFTGEEADPGSVWIHMEDRAAGIRKDGGFVVFWDNGEEERHLILESPYYEEEQITVRMEQFRQKRTPLLVVWLKPGRSYPYGSDIRIEEHKGEPGSVVNIPVEDSRNLVTLVGAYPADRLNSRLIQMKVPQDMELEGRTLHIRRLSDGAEEYFTVQETLNKSVGLYELAEPLGGVYSVYDEEIALVFQVRADENGCFRVPVRR